MKIKTPEERAADEWGNKKLIQENLTTVTVVPKPLTPEEAYCERILTEQLEDAYHLMIENAKKVLAANPNDEKAQREVLQYQQWLRMKDKSKSGSIIIRKGQRCKGQRETGIWTRTRDFGWCLKVNQSAKVGDVVTVRRKAGVTETMELTEQVAPGYFRGKGV
jgi:hypothetical protein